MRHPDVIGAVAVFIVGLIAIAAALTTPDPGFGVVGPAVLPTVLGVLVLVSAAWLARDALVAHPLPTLEPLDRTPLASTVVATALFFTLFVPLGFVLSGAAYLVVEARILGSRRLARDILASVLFALGLDLLFVRILTVDLPHGPLPF